MAEELDTYTPSEAARVLGISKRQVTNLLSSRELEGTQNASGRWSIPQRAVHELLEERRNAGRPPSRSAREPSLARSSSEASAVRDRVEALQRELGRLEGRLELEETARSTIEEQLHRERERADRLEQELRDTQAKLDRGFWARLFGN
jgi:excisionase family DNA binding protein